VADSKISTLSALDGLTAATGDLSVVVDVSDTTMSPSGTNKRMTLGELAKAVINLVPSIDGKIIGATTPAAGSFTTLDASGNLLVGTTTDIAGNNARLNVNQDTSGRGAITLKSAGNADNTVLWNAGTSGDNIFVGLYTEGSITFRGGIDYNRAGGLVRYNTSSDAVLKNIIGDSDLSKSVGILASTRIREYSWKDDPTNKPQIGVIAQELYETFKGAVSVGGEYEETVPAVTEQRLVAEAIPEELDEEGNVVTEAVDAVYETVEVTPEHTVTKYRPWAVDKTAFTFHLVAGFQHLQAENAVLKSQISAIEARLAALEAA